MNVLIVEDEPLLSRRLEGLLKELDPQIQIAGVTVSVAQTLEWLARNQPPDLVFMDIELGDGRSFDILAKTGTPIPVIFTTAYDEFAVQAFRVNSIDYLLKPLKKAELEDALSKFYTWRRSKDTLATLQAKFTALLEAVNPVQKTFRTRFLVKRGQQMTSIEVSDIALFTAHNGLNYLVTRSNKRYLVEYPLDDIEQQLDPAHFFRANRKTILSSGVIKGIHPEPYSKLLVETDLPLDAPIIISRERAKEFKEWLGE
ncbi:MAG TPA: LytTR family DNA-binding domain-containing protein [Flavisolibacter sp.]